MDSYVLLVTVGSVTEAKTIARALVEERLATHVNIIPGLSSIYHWQGKVCEDQELLLLVKVQGAQVAALRERIACLHGDAVPEVMTLPSSDGSTRYLKWLDSCLASS